MVSREEKEQSWKTKAFEEGNAFQLQKYSLGEEQVLASPPAPQPCTALLRTGAHPETPGWTRTLCPPGKSWLGQERVRGECGAGNPWLLLADFSLDSSLSVRALARRGRVMAKGALVMGQRWLDPLEEEENPGVEGPRAVLRTLPIRPCLDRSPGPVTLTQPRRRQPRPAFFGEFLHIPSPEAFLAPAGPCRPLPTSQGGGVWGC